MKIKIKVTDNITGKVITGEKKIRDLDHLKAQQTFKSKVFVDRTKYNRKKKHKSQFED